MTSLDQEAEPLTADVAALRAELPERLAVVMGAEKTGVSATMLGAADRLVFLPMHGFTESLNVSVASTLPLPLTLNLTLTLTLTLTRALTLTLTLTL